ncbi:hypothetical protein JMN32_21520 [Fulvivirga sp. 29W222]|uniref:Uncharacterized protein n=2 Tax=Fulvivirga marina TaxID=2494733 RepID=A0A937KD94_9BACT|nr:hypothetical protein [Fulvivirga marina]
MSSLIKAQVLLNAISIAAVVSIMKTFKVSTPIRILGIIFFCLSYVFVNFWPWYNHTVFVYELVGLAFLVRGIFLKGKYSWLNLVIAGIFIFFSLFTKQDIGGLGLIISLTLLVINNLVEKEFKTTLFFLLSFIATSVLVIAPLLSYEFSYWFNYGQLPHTSRIALFDYLDDTFNEGALILRVYLAAIIIALLYKLNKGGVKSMIADKRQLFFTLFTLALILQVLLAQVTTYIPANAHYYYHSFFFVFIVSQIPQIEFRKPWVFGVLLVLIIFLWSHDYWRYGKRIMQKVFGIEQEVNYNYVSKRTWKLKEFEGPSTDRSDWQPTPFRSLDNVYLPKETIEGIKRLKSKWTGKEDLNVLNMSELTQLAYEIGYIPQAGSNQPLWFHRNVAFFQREVDMICDKIVSKEYDLVLFEVIPMLNRFYPPSVRECLQQYYKLDDKFLAPRIPENAYIEAYVKPQ